MKLVKGFLIFFLIALVLYGFAKFQHLRGLGFLVGITVAIFIFIKVMGHILELENS